MKNILLLCMIVFYSCSQEILLVGETAPVFTLESYTGKSISLKEYRDSLDVVLVFYPGDNTPVCKKQLCEMRDNYSRLQEEGFEVLGINDGDKASHEKFAKKNGYQFPLLIDTDKKVASTYNAVGRFGTKRTVYVVGKDGTILFASRGKPTSFDILDALGR